MGGGLVLQAGVVFWVCCLVLGLCGSGALVRILGMGSAVGEYMRR